MEAARRVLMGWKENWTAANSSTNRPVEQGSDDAPNGTKVVAPPSSSILASLPSTLDGMFTRAKINSPYALPAHGWRMKVGEFRASRAPAINGRLLVGLTDTISPNQNDPLPGS